MGEISEALRRAKAERERTGGHEEPGRGTEAPPPAELPEAEASSGSLAEISDDAEAPWFARAVVVEEHGPVAEHYRHFALRVSRELALRQGRVVLITSAMRDEGKTTTACNLALALASMGGGRKIALLEADLRRPSVARGLGVTPPVGFEQVLRGAAKLRDARIVTDLDGLDLFLVSRPAADPMPLLSGTELVAALRELSRQYDTVIVDTPPVLPVPDVPLIQACADAILIVSRAGLCRRQAFREMMTMVPREKLIGAFLNASGSPKRNRYYGYYTHDGDETPPERS